MVRTFQEVLARSGAEAHASEMRDGYPHRYVFANGSEVVFRETKDVGRFLGPEYGFVYLDEASEEPEKTFKDLTGRLRLGAARGHWTGFLTTNPPHEKHWIAERFGLLPGVTITGPDRYRLIRASSRDNKSLEGTGYIETLLATHSPSEVRRIIDGLYGFEVRGKAVFAGAFDARRHIGEPELRPAPLVRGWDFGWRHPAITWHQVWRCASGQVHWGVLAEMDWAHVEAEKQARDALKFTRQRFPGSNAILDVGDEAGIQHKDSGPGPIVRLAQMPYGLTFRHRPLKEIEPGLDLLRTRMRYVCPCREPVFLVHHSCKGLIDGLAGGYHYPDARPDGTYHDKPRKDGYYDDFIDTVRYVGENLVRSALLGDWGELDDPRGWRPMTGEETEAGWSWMEAGVR